MRTAGYAAVSANAGQAAEVRLKLSRRAFSHWDCPERAWVVEPGTYRIELGRSAGDIALARDIDYS